MLCTLGDLLEDVVVTMRADPVRGGELAVRIHRCQGGLAGTVAVTVASAGGRSRFVGQVGADQLGTELIAALEGAGVDARVARAGRTGTRVVLVGPDGTASRLVDPGAATQLAVVPPDALEEVRLLHVPVAALVADPLATAAFEMIGEAVERRIAVSLDASSVEVVEEFGVGEVLALTEQVRPAVVFCNRAESVALGLGGSAPAPGASLTVVTAGASPTQIVHPDGRVLRVPVPAGPEPLSVHGAGEAFVAGYLLATLADQDPVTAVRAAHLVASRVLATPGAVLGASCT